MLTDMEGMLWYAPLPMNLQRALLSVGVREHELLAITLCCQVKTPKKGRDRKSHHIPPSKLMKVTRMLSSAHDPAFRDLFGVDRWAFEEKIYKRMAPEMLNQTPVRRGRKRLTYRCRLLRFLFFMRGKKRSDIESKFHQHHTTSYRDIWYLVRLFRRVVVPLEVWLPLAGSKEYKRVIVLGNLVFMVPGAAYLADITFVRINKPPAKIQKRYYNVKHQGHGLLYVTVTDAGGDTKAIGGSCPGGESDQSVIEGCDWPTRLRRFVPFVVQYATY